MQDNKSLITRIATRFGVDDRKFYDTLKATAFKQRDGTAPSDEQMMALLIVAEQYGLNPFTREIYAFPDKQNGIIPVVGVDGWSRIINEHPQYDGVEFVYAETMLTMTGANVPCPEWVECVIYRKDRTRAIRVKEFLDEVYREPFLGQGRSGPYVKEGPWQTHTKRQLRHKALIQCCRIAFGFTGIYDQDEAERISAMEHEPTVLSASVNAIPAAELLIEHKEMDPMLNKLAERAVKAHAWSAAQQYVAERYSGTQLGYALQFLQQMEHNHMSSADANTAPADPTLQPTTPPVALEQPDPLEPVEAPPVIDMDGADWYQH